MHDRKDLLGDDETINWGEATETTSSKLGPGPAGIWDSERKSYHHLWHEVLLDAAKQAAAWRYLLGKRCFGSGIQPLISGSSCTPQSRRSLGRSNSDGGDQTRAGSNATWMVHFMLRTGEVQQGGSAGWWWQFPGSTSYTLSPVHECIGKTISNNTT